MTETPEPARPQVLRRVDLPEQIDPRVSAQSAVDMRVSMVLSAVSGRPVEDVAREWGVESSLLHRWLRDFLVAGTSAITNQPDPDLARQRDRFMAAFAHELRTPVAVARGWAMVLEDGDVPEDEVTDAVERLTEALARLSEQINDIELTTAASLGRTRISIEPIDIAALVRELDGSPEVRQGAGLTVHADPQLLSRVLRDLWDTARREPDPESVAIDVVESGPWHEIRVVREGAPITAKVIQALFDPFGTNDDATGVTIGLYMARSLVVAHGGFLGAEGDDNGNVLLARLPREPSVVQEPSGPGDDHETGGTP